MMKPALLSGALLMLVFLGTSVQSNENTPFTVVVIASSDSNKTYSTYTAYKGSLFGGLTRLKYSNQDFDFKYISYDDYGPLLYSVNGLAEHLPDHWWALLRGSEYLPVGMGCYLPEPNEVITLNYTTAQDNLKSHSEL